MPSILNNSACTAIFNLKIRTWSKLLNDKRNAPYEGTLDIWHGYEDGNKLIYFGELANENMAKDQGKWAPLPRGVGEFQYDIKKRDDSIWMFHGIDIGWKKLPVNLPTYSQIALKLFTMNAQFCQSQEKH